jgi:tape measure domain-containing protein
MATEVATLLFEADTRPLKNANDELGKTERAGVRAQDAAKKMGTELKKAANDSINPIQKVTSNVGALSSALTALAGALAVRQFILYTDQWTDLNSRLINATGSAEEADQALRAISETARTTYSSLQQTAQAFLANSMALNELGYTTRQQVELADALNNALVISGTKGERAASVMNALSKALALGKLSGENFNTVIQSGGRLVQALADGLGVTTQELRAMSSEGLITTEAMIEALTGQVAELRREAESMPATIGDAMLQFGNFALEAIGKLDQSAGISSSIADTIIRALAGWRSAYMPDEQTRFNDLLAERLELEEKLLKNLLMPSRRQAARDRVEEIRAEMTAMRDANVERQMAESAAVAAGVAQRAAAEAQRIADHEAELARIAAEKQARADAAAEERRLADILRAQRRKTSGSKIDNLAEIERKQNQDRFVEMVRYNRIVSDLEKQVEDRRVAAAAQQTQQLLEFDNILLRNKSQTTQASYRIGVSLMNQEKRQAAQKIITDSYAAAMAAWKSLAGIPFVGPALGAAAAGGIIAAGVSYSAKSLAGRALGGQVLAGESYVVGERGPEVLTMGSTNGKIIPNSSVNKAPVSGTVNRVANVSFNISANDAQGFESLLTASRGKIIDIINTALNDGGREAIL